MSGAEATAEFEPAIKELGDQLVKLSILEAKSLGDYIKEEYGIEPAAGGAVMMAGPADGGPAEEEVKTEFDLVLTSFGDNKIPVIKVVRAATGLGLKEAKALVEGVPKAVKEAISEDDAKKLKEEIEAAGGSCEIK